MSPTTPLPHPNGRPGYVPRTATTRSSSPVQVADLAGRLTGRDRWLLAMVHEHRVLTATQLHRLAFTGLRTAQRRLRALHNFGVLDSFRPLVASGSAPQHYTLGPTGAAILAAERGLEPAGIGWRPQTTARIAYSPSLTHDIAVNDHFSKLAAHTRTTRTPCYGLVLWLSARSAARRWGDLVRPDAYAHWHSSRAASLLPVFFEHDTGTENLTRLIAKLDAYAIFTTATLTRPALLIHTRTAAREQSVRRRLADTAQAHGLPVATASAEATGAAPWASCWAPLTLRGRRTTLDDLANHFTGLTAAPGLAADDNAAEAPFPPPVPPLPPDTDGGLP